MPSGKNGEWSSTHLRSRRWACKGGRMAMDAGVWAGRGAGLSQRTERIRGTERTRAAADVLAMGEDSATFDPRQVGKFGEVAAGVFVVMCAEPSQPTCLAEP